MSDFETYLQLAYPKLASARVLETHELVRIRELPWQRWQDQPDDTEPLTQFLRVPGSTARLRPMQAAVLSALARYRGVLCTGRTSSGKTLPSLTAATVTGLDNAVLIVPAAMRSEAREATYRYGQDWRIRPLRILSYEQLGRPDARDLLLRIGPNLIVADECQALSSHTANVTGRFMECVKQFRPKLLFLSGSITNRSLRDFEHLLRLIMGDGTPIPHKREEFQMWCAALDVKVRENRPDPGALLTLAPGQRDEPEDRLDLARARFARRLHACPQIIGTGADIPDVPLYSRIVELAPSPAMQELVRYFDTHDATPCGQTFAGDPLARWRHHREASCGIYRRWKIIPPTPWLEARKLWHGLVRDIRTRYPRFDSPVLIANAIDRGEIDDYGILHAWREIEPTFDPVTEAVWICDSTLNWAAEWLARQQGICWVEHIEFGERLSRMTGVPYFREQGCDATGKKISKHRGAAIASISSCSRGFNLHEVGQHQNVFVTTPTTNKRLEQAISRTHRDGQDKAVYVEFLQRLEGDRAALAQAQADAEYTARITLQPQRIQVTQWAASA